MKHAVITPIYKSGSHLDCYNYCPISVLPLFSKVFEYLIHDQLSFYLQSNNLLSINQYGFTKTCNTTDAVFRIIKSISSNAINKK